MNVERVPFEQLPKSFRKKHSVEKKAKAFFTIIEKTQQGRKSVLSMRRNIVAKNVIKYVVPKIPETSKNSLFNRRFVYSFLKTDELTDFISCTSFCLVTFNF